MMQTKIKAARNLPIQASSCLASWMLITWLVSAENHENGQCRIMINF